MTNLEKMPNNCLAVEIYADSKEHYWAFLTPEASNALNHYHDIRKNNGEILEESNTSIFSNTESHTKSQKHLSSKSARRIISDVIRNSGICREKKGNICDKATIYGFRKRFNTILKLNNNVNPPVAEKLMAHKRGLDGRYMKANKDEYFIEFQKAIPELTISDENRIKIHLEESERENTENEKLQSTLLENQKLYLAVMLDMKQTMADLIISLGKKGSKILDENPNMKKHIDFARNSNIEAFRNSDAIVLVDPTSKHKNLY